MVASSDGVWLSGATSPDPSVVQQMTLVGDPWAHVDPVTGKLLGPMIGAGSGPTIEDATVGGGYLWIASDVGRTMIQAPAGGSVRDAITSA